MYLGYCTTHFILLFKLNSFFNLSLFSSGIHNGRGKKLTNNYMSIKQFFMVETCKKAVDQGKEYRPLLTNIFQGF